MSLGLFLRRTLENLPPPVGSLLARLPFGLRPGLGRLYTRRRRELAAYARLDQAARQQFIFTRVRDLAAFAVAHVPFYRDLYAQQGFSLEQLRSFDDLARLPIVTKAMLRAWDLEQRSFPRPGRYVVNTGGSSGEPLSFYIEPSSMAHEWAHMHEVWRRVGYHPYDLKLVFAGRHSSEAGLKYDAVRHHYAVNIYRGYETIAEELLQLLRRRRVRYLHGYPSAIYEFATFCEERSPELQARLRSMLRGALLSSEYPQPTYRDRIETVFGIPSISWYGHTERAILAYERTEPFLYEPLQTYGYCEAVASERSGEYRLLGTSYYNLASPLIRYDTGDLVGPIEAEGGILARFRVASGREGEFIVDGEGRRIALTGLIFGRHHPLFGRANFIQVRQEQPGRATILVVPAEGDDLGAGDCGGLFDGSGVAVEFDFELLAQPVRTASGKINLLVQ